MQELNLTGNVLRKADKLSATKCELSHWLTQIFEPSCLLFQWLIKVYSIGIDVEDKVWLLYINP